MAEEIITLKDNAVTDISIEEECLSEGCDTCGYGSDYCKTLTISFADRRSLTYERHREYNYDRRFTVGYFIRLFCANIDKFADMTTDEFRQFIFDQLYKDFEGDE